jgi:hypothetical protein
MLQFGPLAPRVHELLDTHLAAVPPKEQQDEDDRLWRLAIHRMDSRQYTVTDAPATDIVESEAKPGDPPGRYLRLDPKPPEADVQAMVDEGTGRRALMDARLADAPLTLSVMSASERPCSSSWTASSILAHPRPFG